MERLIPQGKLPFKSAREVSFSKIGIGFEKLDRNVFDPEKAYDKVAKIGVKKIRLQSGWMRTEQEKGVYDFAWLDKIIDNVIARGMEPWLCICYGNPLYTDLAKEVFGAVGCPPISTEEEYTAWLNYVKAVAEHYKGIITLYEIWNEPDNKFSWKHPDGQTPEHAIKAPEYGEFVRRSSQAMKSVDPDCKIIANFAHLYDLQYVHLFLSTPGVPEAIDYMSYHAYSAKTWKRYGQIMELRRLLDVHNPKIGLIQGESGTQSRSDGNGALKRFAWTPAKQTKYLLRTLLQDIAAGVEFTSYFSAMDMIEGLHGLVADKASYLDYGYFGVISATFDGDGRATGNYTEKPSYYALSTLASLFTGDVQVCPVPVQRELMASRRVNGFDCDENSVQTYSFRLHDGRRVLCYWNDTDILTSTYEGTISFNLYGLKRENISLIDLQDGSIYAIADSMVEDLGCGAFRLVNMPLTDAPLALMLD